MAVLPRVKIVTCFVLLCDSCNFVGIACNVNSIYARVRTAGSFNFKGYR